MRIYLFTFHNKSYRVKKLFLSIIFSIIFFSVDAQNTWVQKLSYSTQMHGYYDTLVGAVQFDYGPDN